MHYGGREGGAADYIADYEGWCRKSYVAKQLPTPRDPRASIRESEVIWTIIVALVFIAWLAEMGGEVALR
jgi:hypothetical protein